MRTNHVVNIVWFKLLRRKGFVNTITVHLILSKSGRLVVRLLNLLAIKCWGTKLNLCSDVTRFPDHFLLEVDGEPSLC